MSNVGLDENWTGNHLSQANLYGFGRLAWNPDLTRRADRRRVDAPDIRQRSEGARDGQRRSNSVPGARTRTTPDRSACRPSPTSRAITTASTSKRRSATAGASGIAPTKRASAWTAPSRQAPATSANTARRSRASTNRSRRVPDDLLLFLHHVPYTHKLHSGKTVIQYIYDSHYEGADARRGVRRASGRRSKAAVDEQRYRRDPRATRIPGGAGDRLARRRERASSRACRASPDAKGRVGNYPGRVEAEAMKLDGLRGAGHHAVGGRVGRQGRHVRIRNMRGDDEVRGRGRAGTRSTCSTSICPRGEARFRVLVGKQVIDEWTAADRIPARRLDAGASSRRVIAGVALRPGDEIRIEGVPGPRRSGRPGLHRNSSRKRYFVLPSKVLQADTSPLSRPRRNHPSAAPTSRA